MCIPEHLQRLVRYCINTRPTGSCLYKINPNPQAMLVDGSIIGPNTVGIIFDIYLNIRTIIINLSAWCYMNSKYSPLVLRAPQAPCCWLCCRGYPSLLTRKLLGRRFSWTKRSSWCSVLTSFSLKHVRPSLYWANYFNFNDQILVF